MDSYDAYTAFAEVYDEFMDNIPYGEWCEYLTGLLKKYGVDDGLVLDLGCGTGTLTELLDDRGYDMIGVDNADEMLQVAMEKRAESGKNILYLLQDMRDFELYGTVRAIVSICDSMNYITERDDLVQVLKLANNYLDPKGVFIFDMKTEYYYKNVTGDTTIAEDREDKAFIWDNYYDEETHINEYAMSIFIRETEDDLFRRYQEFHYQRAYSLDEIKSCIEEAGMVFVDAFEAFTEKEPGRRCERMYIVCQEQGK